MTRIVLAVIFCGLVVLGMSSFFSSNTPTPRAPVAQNVDHRMVRQALINAADWAESSPCDAKYKEPLHQAFLAYVADAQTTTDIPDDEVKAIAQGALVVRIVSMSEMAGFGRLVWRDEKTTTFHSAPSDYTPRKERHFACDGDNSSDPWAAIRAAGEAQRAQQPMRLPDNAGN